MDAVPIEKRKGGSLKVNFLHSREEGGGITEDSVEFFRL